MKQYILSAAFFGIAAYAENNLAYYDAKEISYDTKIDEITATGEAFALLDTTFLLADIIKISNEKHLVTAQGNVRVFREKEKFYATKAVFNLETNETFLSDVDIEAGVNKSDPFSVLSSNSELFEKRKKKLIEKIGKSSSILKRLDSINKLKGNIYISASSLYQKGENPYELAYASITPCNCSKDMRPLFGFGAAYVIAEGGRYLDLYAASFEIFDIPLFYAPWIKIPIKSRRQSGFLLPSFYFSQSGDALSLPFYVTLGESADDTMSASIFSERGMRFDNEFRLLVTDQSRVTVRSEYLYDSLIATELQKYNAALAARGKQSHSITAANSHRWYLSALGNLELGHWGGLHGDLEILSDNRYLSDFSKNAKETLDLFSTSQFSRRFLAQEFGIEFYGDNGILSMRAQGLKDLFFESYQDIPQRMPRLEYMLFPKRYFGVSFYHYLSWERIHRLGKKSFIDVPQLEKDKNGVLVTAAPNERKDPNEAYLEGDRSKYLATFSLPFFKNKYLNTNVSLVTDLTAYRFSKVTPYPDLYPAQALFKYQIGSELPFFWGLERFSIQDSSYDLRQNLRPFVTLEYVPYVFRSPFFPSRAQIFYLEDAQSKRELIKFGLISNLQLKQYTDKTTSDWTMELLNLGVSWSYNFIAKDTAYEDNRNLLPHEPRAIVQPIGDLKIETLSSFEPLLPVHVKVGALINFEQEAHIKTLSIGTGANLFFGLSGTVTNAFDAKKVTINGFDVFKPVHRLEADVSLSPLSWLQFQYQILTKEDHSLEVRPASEFEYASSQAIKLVKVQDCMDLSLRRTKDFGVKEASATWSLSLNVNFFGYQRQLPDLGKPLDKSMKEYFAK